MRAEIYDDIRMMELSEYSQTLKHLDKNLLKIISKMIIINGQRHCVCNYIYSIFIV